MGVYWGAKTYSKEEFIDAWTDSISISEAARKLGLTIYGSTYKTLRAAAKELDLNEDHFLGQGWNKGGKHQPNKPRPIEEYLVEGSRIGSSSLKAKLFKDGLKEKQCEMCGISEWLGKPAPLALDHINGVNNDNRLENLRILCYNCHGQTETFCRGQKLNKKVQERAEQRAAEKEARRVANAKRLKNQRVGFIKGCVDCDKTISRTATRCKSCTGRERGDTIDYPPVESLVARVKDIGFSAAGREIGCSDNAIRKHLKREGYDPKTLEKQPDD